MVTSDPTALDVGLAQRDALITFRDLTLHRVEHLVLEEHDQVVVADRGQQQSARIGRCRWRDAFDARHVREDRVVNAGVLRGGIDPGPDHRPDHQRALGLAAEHVAQLGALVEDLVHAAAEEVDKHQLGDRAQPGRGRADCRADESGLGNRRVQDAVATELLDQALGDAHRTAPGVVVDQVIDLRAAGDIFAHQDDARVLAHRHAHRFVDRIADRSSSRVSSSGNHLNRSSSRGQRRSIRNVDVGQELALGSGHGAALASFQARSRCSRVRVSIASSSSAVAMPCWTA